MPPFFWIYKLQVEGRNYEPKKEFAIECAQGDQPVRSPNRGFCVYQPLAVPSGGVLVVFPWCVGGGTVMKKHVRWDVEIWCDVM